MAKVTTEQREAVQRRTGDRSFPMETGAQIRSAIKLRGKGKTKSAAAVLRLATAAVSRLLKAGKISESTAADLRRLIAQAKGRGDMESTYLVDQFAVLERIAENLIKLRLFPFGRLVKNGVERIITPELAGRFRLPHFKPPVKLGSHEDATPAGGRIIGLEVGEDGLYGLVLTTDKGEQALSDRDYAYQSPEVVWEDGYLEHPETGEPIHGPLIVGDAWLHTPHLGEAAALYSIQPISINGGASMTEAQEMISVSTLDKLAALFGLGVKEPREQEPVPVAPAQQEDYVAKFQAEQARVETLNAEIAKMKAEQNKEARIAHFAAELPNEGEDTHTLLASLEDEVAEKLETRFKALYAQIGQQPDKKVGNAGQPEGMGTDPQQALNTAVLQYAAENKVPYHEAFGSVTATHPELLADYYDILRGVK